MLSISSANGAAKLNIAKGEPLLYPDMLVTYAKTVAGLQAVSIISNCNQFTSEWFEQYGYGIRMGHRLL